MAINLKSLRGIAIAGVRARPSTGEELLGATMTDTKLVISYRSTTIEQEGKARFRCRRLRMVTCTKLWQDGDYVWAPSQVVVSDLSRTKIKPGANRYDWFVPVGKAVTK